MLGLHLEYCEEGLVNCTQIKGRQVRVLESNVLL